MLSPQFAVGQILFAASLAERVMTRYTWRILAFATALGAGSPALMAQTADTGTALQPEPINVQFEAGVMRDNNATRAGSGPARIGDTASFFSVTTSLAHPLTEHARLWMTGTAGVEKFRRFDGLSRLHGSAELEYQYRASSDFNEPTYGAFVKLTGEEFDSDMRDGYRVGAGLSVRQSLNDRISYSASVAHNARRATDKVFSGSENMVRGNVDLLLTNRALLYFSGEYRRGDIVATGWPNGGTPNVSSVFWWDDAFAAEGMVSYRLRGSSVQLTLGLNYEIAPRHSIDFSLRQIRTRAASSPNYVSSELSYKSSQLSVAYLFRF